MMKTGDLIACTAIVLQLGLLQACGGRGLTAADANGPTAKPDTAVADSGGSSGAGGARTEGGASGTGGGSAATGGISGTGGVSAATGGASGNGGVSAATGGASGGGGNPGAGGQSVVAQGGGTSGGGSGGKPPATGGSAGSASGGSVATGGTGVFGSGGTGPGSGGTAGHTGGGSGTALTGGTGGSGSGGRSGTGGNSVPSGTGGAAGTAGTTVEGTGGTSTGGVGGSAGTGGAGGIGTTTPLTTGSCTAPCGLKLGTTPLPGSSPTSQGALLYFNVDTGVATLKDAPDPSGTAGEILLGFEFESATNSSSLDHGYSIYSQGNNLWSEWVEPYQYDTKVGPYSVAQFVLMTEELVDVQSNKLIVAKYYLADQGVVVQSVGVPTCTAGSGSCQTANSCPIVNSGAAGDSATTCDKSCSGAATCAAQCVATASGLPVACADCYARFAACTRSNCTGEYECPTPRLAGNGCLRCQVDKGCHHDFMACSGLDYMPLGTFLLPLPNL